MSGGIFSHIQESSEVKQGHLTSFLRPIPFALSFQKCLALEKRYLAKALQPKRASGLAECLRIQIDVGIYPDSLSRLIIKDQQNV